MINSRDELPIDRNGVIKSHPFDHIWSVRICSQRVKEKLRHFDRPLDLHRAVTMHRGVHRSRSISTVITLRWMVNMFLLNSF